MAKFYVTTPIYYVNDKPHIGHAYSTIVADVLARYHREQGYDVMFTTGTDENSQKTAIAAEKAGISDIRAYTDSMAATWQSTWQKLGISSTRFIRTTDADHAASVKAFIKAVEAAGDIYQDAYEGLYCVGHEAFISEDELVDGLCPDHKKAPEIVKEQNYFFRLSKYQDALLQHIEAHPEFIQPESRRNEVVAFIKRGLHDLSVSRNKNAWGIPWPGDKDQVVYVWFDALVNYLTSAGYPGDTTQWWPADLHIVGKDITKFHCVYWPAMLMSAGAALPQTVFGHGFFTVDGQKISKSLGNAVDPTEIAEVYGVDALRYYLLREIPFGADGEFTRARFEMMYNTDLANELGNLVQRVAVMLTRYQGGVVGDVPPHTHDVHAYHEHMRSYQLDRALGDVWDRVKGANQFIEEEKPWQLAKTDSGQLSVVLAQAVSDLSQIAILLLPFLPETSAKILKTFAGGKVDSGVGLLFPKNDQITEATFEIGR